jgi:hypothetical protein
MREAHEWDSQKMDCVGGLAEQGEFGGLVAVAVVVDVMAGGCFLGRGA